MARQTSSVARGRSFHSACSITRRCKVSGVSPASISTAFCRMISPPSGISLTKCTVAPVTFTPRASAASCTFKPYMPLPQNDGISDGWIFRMRRGHFFVKFSLRMLKKPARTMTSILYCSSSSSIAASKSCWMRLDGTVCAGTFAFSARSSA